MWHKNKEKAVLKNILDRKLIDYFVDNIDDASTNYDVIYNEEGVYLTTVIQQFISTEDLNSLRANKRRKVTKIRKDQKLHESLSGSSNSSSETDFNEEELHTNKLNESESNLCDLLLNTQIPDEGKISSEGGSNEETEESLKSKSNESLISKSNESSKEDNTDASIKEDSSDESLISKSNESSKEDNSDESIKEDNSDESIKEDNSDESIKEDNSDESIKEDNSDEIKVYRSIQDNQKDCVKAGILPVLSTDDEEEDIDTFDTQTLMALKKTPIDQILQEHINNLKVKFRIPDPETDDSEFFRTVTEDTVGYIKDLYESKLIEIFNKLNGINEKKIDLMQLLKRSYGRYFFSTAGTSMLLFNRLDMPFVSAWQEYLEYSVEMDNLEMKDTLKGFFRFKM